jgi:hypothetical protein
LPFSFSESPAIVNGSFESWNLAKFVQKSASFSDFGAAFFRVYHVCINHKPRVADANRFLTYARGAECAAGGATTEFLLI